MNRAAKNSQENISKLNPAIHQKGHPPLSSGIYSRNARLDNLHKSINAIHHINKVKVNNHMIISIEAENAFDEI